MLIRAMPTSTVEDYLKQICLEQDRNGGAMVSPGRIAGALGVAPATVTAMMKTLTESGLAIYEPYAGVKLSPAGHKMAMHVLRRHRLIELFLVRFMSMDWSEVHQEAEVLEHAISDRILQRMDDMLGRPSVDPHGDPIPSASGQLPSIGGDSLLTCPTGVPLRVARVTDQRAEFLQLLERYHLKPGTLVRIDSRDELAGMVLVHPEGLELLRLGFDAAARILVESQSTDEL